MLPGVGTKEDIIEAQGNGGSICRIATHCTEADVSIQHFGSPVSAVWKPLAS